MPSLPMLEPEEEWRNFRPGLLPKLAYVLETKKFTDVTFRVGCVETFHAHRLVLMRHSYLFNSKFFSNFDKVVRTEDFLNITKDNLRLFVKDDNTAGLEIDIFDGITRWAEAECTRNGLAQHFSNHRSIVEDILTSIRFPIMSSEDFALRAIPSGVLTPEESTLLFQHMAVYGKNSLINVLPEK